MYKYIKIISNKHFFKIVLLTIFIIISGFLEMIGIGTIVLFVNSILDQSTGYYSFLNKFSDYNLDIKYFSTLNISVALLSIFIFKNLFVFFVKIFEHYMTYSIKIDNNKKIFNFYTESTFLDHKDFIKSDLIRNLTTDNSQAATYIQNQIIMIRELFIAFVIFLILILSDTLIILSIFSFLFIISYLFIALIKKKLNLYGKLIFHARSKILEVSNNLLLGIKDIKLLKIENFVKSQFQKNDKEAQKSQFFYDVYQSAPRLFIEIMIVIVICLVAIKFNFSGDSNTKLVTSLSLLGASFIRLLPAFSAVTTAISKNKFLRPSFDIIYSEIIKSENFFKNKKIGKQLDINDFKEIHLKNVDFKFPKQENYLFKNLNFKIIKGDIFCISGPSGEGKTTICDLITNLIQPTKGEILINGINTNDISSNSFKKTISFVTQKPFFKEGTIKESLCYGLDNNFMEKKNTEKYLVDLLKIVKLEELVDDANNKLTKTFVSKLSGGQIQRLGLARAILKKPQLLILDEGTNALDLNLEQEVFENINRFIKKITIILISHRSETKSFANKIFDIQKKILLKNEVINN